MGKLVRDRIPDIIKADGRHPDVRVLDDQEFRAELLLKLQEEALEAAQAPPEKLLEELADVYEVTLALLDLAGLTDEALVRSADRKRTERGGFRSRTYLVSW